MIFCVKFNILKLRTVLISLFIFHCSVSKSQQISGTWEGLLKAGDNLHIILRIQQTEYGYIGNIQSPDQTSEYFPCSSIAVLKDSVFVVIKSLEASYSGKLNYKTISGNWCQNGLNLPLVLNQVPELKEKHLLITGSGRLREIDSVVLYEMQNLNIAGLSIGIISHGKVLVCKGYGYADVQNSIAADCKTAFKLGSLSKQFIATAIIQLQEQSKLSLTDHLSKYLPDVPKSWENITIKNLLNHTSGLERESPAFSWKKNIPDSTLVHAAYNDNLLFETGKSWKYSNLGYFILAEIIRKVTGQSFESYMNDFFKKSGMNNTITVDLQTTASRAVGYMTFDAINGKYIQAPDYKIVRPSGAFASTVSDLIKWDSILSGSHLLSKEDWLQMWNDSVVAETTSNGKKISYGYGWFITPYRKYGIIHHGGNTPGFTSEYWHGREDELTIIILTNGNEINAGRIAKELYNLLN